MKRLFISCVFVFALLSAFLACDSNFKDVQRINTVAFAPVSSAEDINLKYTDSGRVKAILVSPLMKDFSNLEYGFNEFPEGINVTLIDDNGKKSYIVADYAITYAETDIIDLQGNVKITSEDGTVLETSQLYYDQRNEWFYTEERFKLTDPEGGYIEGPGIDFSKDFSIVNAQQNTGEINNVE